MSLYLHVGVNVDLCVCKGSRLTSRIESESDQSMAVLKEQDGAFSVIYFASASKLRCRTVSSGVYYSERVCVVMSVYDKIGPNYCAFKE